MSTGAEKGGEHGFFVYPSIFERSSLRFSRWMSFEDESSFLRRWSFSKGSAGICCSLVEKRRSDFHGCATISRIRGCFVGKGEDTVSTMSHSRMLAALNGGRGCVRDWKVGLLSFAAQFTRMIYDRTGSIVSISSVDSSREREKGRGEGKKTLVFGHVSSITLIGDDPPYESQPRSLIIPTRADDDLKSKHLSS